MHMDNASWAIGLVGLGLSIFGAGFTMWSLKLKEVMDIAQKIDTDVASLSKDFHHHQVEIERRLSHVESKVNGK